MHVYQNCITPPYQPGGLRLPGKQFIRATLMAQSENTSKYPQPEN